MSSFKGFQNFIFACDNKITLLNLINIVKCLAIEKARSILLLQAEEKYRKVTHIIFSIIIRPH